MNINDLIENLQRMIQNDIPISASYWVESALKINAMKGSLDNEVAVMESEMMDEECRLLEEGKTSAYASKIKTQKINYERYLQKRAMVKRIEEHIRLSKKRSTINEI